MLIFIKKLQKNSFEAVPRGSKKVIESIRGTISEPDISGRKFIPN